MTTPVAGGNSDGSTLVAFDGTDPAVFVADSDPASKTDSLDSDSDGGGICDGSLSISS